MIIPSVAGNNHSLNEVFPCIDANQVKENFQLTSVY